MKTAAQKDMDQGMRELGYIDGRMGFEIREPNNTAYLKAYAKGEKVLYRELDANRPFDSMLPGGTNDANFDSNY